MAGLSTTMNRRAYFARDHYSTCPTDDADAVVVFFCTSSSVWVDPLVVVVVVAAAVVVVFFFRFQGVFLVL